jgi:threonylcarbamoyladenosine tRNA methylthiotransferase CDKAL1
MICFLSLFNFFFFYQQGLILDSGMELTDDAETADVFVINSCTVKNPSQDAFLNLVNKYHKKGAVIAAGCVPQGDPHISMPSDVSVVGVEQIHKVVDVIHSALQGKPLRLTERERPGLPSLSIFYLSLLFILFILFFFPLVLPRRRGNRFIESIPISVGCLNSCTYCKTKAARGVLKSYPIPHIIESVKRAIKNGVREIRLVSEDTGCYGMDIKSTLPELLETILNILPPHVCFTLPPPP